MICLSTDSGTENKRNVEIESKGNFTGVKKGRPMTDMNIIKDDINNKIYNPNSDYVEYMKARKYLIFN